MGYIQIAATPVRDAGVCCKGLDWRAQRVRARTAAPSGRGHDWRFSPKGEKRQLLVSDLIYQVMRG